MLFEDTKSLVGENCSEYDSKSIFYKAKMTNLARNCISCYNYVNGNCTKNLFQEIYENLKNN